MGSGGTETSLVSHSHPLQIPGRISYCGNFPAGGGPKSVGGVEMTLFTGEYGKLYLP